MKVFSKRVLTMLLTIALLCGCAGSQGGETGKAGVGYDEYLMEKGRGLTELIMGFSASEEYIGMYSWDTEIAGTAAEIHSGIEGRPKAAVVIEPNIDMLLSAVMDSEGIGNIVGDEREYLSARALSLLPNMLNSQSGSTSLATASMLSVTESYQTHAELKPALLLLLYDGDWAVCVSFAPSKEDTALVSAIPLKLQPDWQGYLEAGELQEVIQMLPGDTTFRRIADADLERLWGE